MNKVLLIIGKLDKHYRKIVLKVLSNISEIIKINVDEIDFVNNEEDCKYVLDLIDENLGN